jgi:alpha-galactosidase
MRAVASPGPPRSSRVRLGDDVDTPGGRLPVVVDPARVTTHGPWRVHAWPDLDLPVGTLVALRVPFPAEAGQRYVANGWQSWSAPTVRRLGHEDAAPPRRGLSRRHLFRLAGAGDSSYDMLVTAGAVAGFLAGGGLLVADPERGVVHAVRRHVGCPHPPVRVAVGDGAALADDLLERAGGVSPPTSPVGWSTWGAFRAEFDADRLSGALAGVRALAEEGLCDLVMVDDGWQRAIGDWAPDPRRFGATLASLADQVRAAGTGAGLWTAPLLVSPHSDLAARRPDWVARSADGRPVVGAQVPHWGGSSWVLDATRSDVRDHVAAVAAAHAAAGFTMFKLDFLYAAADAADAAVARCRAGQPATGDVLGADAVHSAVLDAVRAAVGPSVTLLGCGAPLWPSIGRVDWMRVGPDVTDDYRPSPEPDSDPAMVACLRNGWRSAALRAPMHRRLWGNDPDQVPLAARHRGLTPEHRLGFARWVAATGQLLTLADRLGDLAAGDLDEWRRLVARSRRLPRVAAERSLAPVLS